MSKQFRIKKLRGQQVAIVEGKDEGKADADADADADEDEDSRQSRKEGRGGS
jgi:hypothetical protein